MLRGTTGPVGVDTKAGASNIADAALEARATFAWVAVKELKLSDYQIYPFWYLNLSSLTAMGIFGSNLV